MSASIEKTEQQIRAGNASLRLIVSLALLLLCVASIAVETHSVGWTLATFAGLFSVHFAAWSVHAYFE